jgi:uncharacterized membrane protein
MGLAGRFVSKKVVLADSYHRQLSNPWLLLSSIFHLPSSNFPMSRLSWFIVAITFSYALWLFPQLPERIPMHFGPDGTPDAWGSRGTIFIAVGISLFMQFFLAFLPKFGASISPNVQKSKNPEAELAWAMRFIEGVRVWVAGLFLVIVWNTGNVALGETAGLTWIFYTYVGVGVVVILTLAIRGSRMH